MCIRDRPGFGVLFDLYRAIGQQHKFECLALDYAQRFGWSAPQWFSIPRLVAEAVGEERTSASRINVACSRLIRVDFIAAGDLLNWVLKRRNENRSVHFVDAHRMIALFFGAMGINEHASVKVRTL